MTDQPAIDIDPADHAVVLRNPETPIQEKALPVTAAQAKVEAVAQLTMTAYAKASQLVLTPEECEKLQSDFPDDAFRSGAGGKENLIYIEHAHLRDRLNQVFGPGQWAIVPRNRWSEDFTTQGNKPGVRIYVEAMLCIRGCFVAEAVGDMEYYPHNAGTNYGDCVEGAKSGCLRRCAKELGIGLQAWKKDWCDGWWKRKRGGTGATGAPTPMAKKPVPQPATKPPATSGDVLPKDATAATKTWFLAQLRAQFSDAVLQAYAVTHNILVPEVETVGHWPLHHVATTRQACTELIAKIGAWERANAPKTEGQEGDEWFWEIVVPVPHKGQKRDEYLKNPDTIRSLYDARHEDEDSRSRLFGFLSYYEPKGWTNREGKEMPPNATDLKFREALDEFGKWFQNAHPDEQRD